MTPAKVGKNGTLAWGRGTERLEHHLPCITWQYSLEAFVSISPANWRERGAFYRQVDFTRQAPLLKWLLFLVSFWSEDKRTSTWIKQEGEWVKRMQRNITYFLWWCFYYPLWPELHFFSSASFFFSIICYWLQIHWHIRFTHVWTYLRRE